MSIAVLLAAVLACVICQAFFAASEVALVAADDLKVHAERERGDRRAMVLGRLLERRDRVVAMLLTGNNLATVIAAAALTSFLHDVSPRTSYFAPFILAPVSLLVGESIPKMAVLRAPLRFARKSNPKPRLLPNLSHNLIFKHHRRDTSRQPINRILRLRS